mgnify:FL=1
MYELREESFIGQLGLKKPTLFSLDASHIPCILFKVPDQAIPHEVQGT